MEKDKPETPVAENENPRANENIRISTEEPTPTEGATDKVGSEITDGESS